MAARVLVVTAIAAGLLSAGCGGGSSGEAGSRRAAAEAHRVLEAKLTGDAEVPPTRGTGSGTAQITLDQKTGKACRKLSVKGLGHPLSAHVHKGNPGMTGPVVIPLGARFALRGCVLTPKATLSAVAAHPAAYYVNVHTTKYLNGAVRGRLAAG